MNINDIAKLAGVSITTVSRVINQKNVGKLTKMRVTEIIERYGYQPNLYAQCLGRRRNGK